MSLVVVEISNIVEKSVSDLFSDGWGTIRIRTWVTADPGVLRGQGSNLSLETNNKVKDGQITPNHQYREGAGKLQRKENIFVDFRKNG